MQVLMDARFRRLTTLEEKLNGMAMVLQQNQQSQLKRLESSKIRQQQQQFHHNYINHQNHHHHQLPALHNGHNHNHYGQDVLSSFLEPIIDIHVNEEENGECLKEEEVEEEEMEEKVDFKQAMMQNLEANSFNVQSNGVSNGSEENKVDSETLPIPVVDAKNVRRSLIQVTSKTEFLHLVEKLRRENNLCREQVAENVYVLRTRDTESILGYQCSVDGCNYMHFLRAQVNRHFKNFHSKACGHCNQRFKKPTELVAHLEKVQNGTSKMIQEAQQLQQQQQQQQHITPTKYRLIKEIKIVKTGLEGVEAKSLKINFS